MRRLSLILLSLLLIGGVREKSDLSPITRSGAFFWQIHKTGKVLRSKDKGKTWQEQNLSDALYRDLYFLDSLHGWLVGERDERGIILHTTDGGETWVNQSPPPPTPASEPVSYLKVHFANRRYGMILAEKGYLLATYDGGITWSWKFAGENAESLWNTWSQMKKR